jgi:hypothetical protein
VSLRFSIPITLRSLGRGFHVVPDAETDAETEAQRGRQEPAPIDYAPLADASRQVGLWLLDVARSRTSDPLDLPAIDRVQRAFLASFSEAPCRRPDVSEEDLLTVAGILITAFEIDLAAPGLGAVAGSLYDETDGDLGQVRSAVAAAIAQRAVRSHLAKRRVVGVVPIIVRRRPRIVDDEALDDATLR